jgi:formylglycine-generating enzyme required for sulfatase activity
MGREKQVIEMPEAEAGTEPDLWPDLQPLLDQEVSRLPDKYRLAIVLCDLESKTRKEAARQLKIPEGTLSSRLTTARTMLAKRLARYGLAVSGVSVAAVLSQNVASAAVPTMVLSSTIKAVTLVAAGKTAAAGQISAKVAALTEGVVKSMLLTKLKTVTTLMLSMVTLTSVMVLAWGQTGPASTGDKGNGVEKPAAKDEKQAAQAQSKDPPKNFTNSIGMKFVWIPPGTFMMGSPKQEKEREANEIQHKVTLTKGFYVGVYAVTQEQWKEVMGYNPSGFKGEKNLPVDTVSWDDCQEFVKKLREADKKAYRLPTESEWEFCCRAGTKTPFHFGDTISTDQSNFNGNCTYGDGKKGVYREKTTPVGSFAANAWELHDMHGNVFQWCQDWLGDYPQKDVVDPTGPEKGELRVVRGGSWNAPPCRSACRGGDGPDSHRHVFGCRLCFCLD